MNKNDVDKPTENQDKTVWLDEHVQLLLTLYEETKNQQGKTVAFKNKTEMFKTIAQQMQKKGLTYSGKQISNKWRAIRRRTNNQKLRRIIKEQQLEIKNNDEKLIQEYCRVCQAMKICEIDLTDKVENIDNIDTYLDCYNFVLNTNITFESDVEAPKLCIKCCNDLLVAYNFCLKAQQVEQQISVQSPIDLPDDDPLMPVIENEDDNHFVAANESDEEISKKWYNCKKCKNTMFDSLNGLLEHEQVVHEPKQYVCKLCGKIFQKQLYLSRHIKRHSNVVASDQVFQCNYCERSYKTKNSLTYHERSHLGKTTPCDVCHKEFVCKKDLKRHMSFHTRDFPYICEHCGRKFAISSHLKQHYLRHKNMRCECPVCGKQFLVAHSLYQHYYKHTGQMPYPCCYCERQYPSMTKYKYHLKNVHKKEATDMEIEKSRMKCPKDKLVKPQIKWVESATPIKNYIDVQDDQIKIESDEIDFDEMEWIENAKLNKNYKDDQQMRIESDEVDID